MSQIELPAIECVENKDTYGVITTCEPHLPRGFGITIGNALRRVLLNSLPGVAVTWIKIDGVHHGFTTIPDVKEDTMELLLNVRAVRLRSLLSDLPASMLLEVKGKKGGRVVTAADIKPMDGIDIVNPELYLASLDSDKARLFIEFNVEEGVGYRVASNKDLPMDVIPVDAVFAPVRRVNYKVEPVRSRENRDSEKLTMEIWTDGTILPIEALNRGAQILADYISPFVVAAVAVPEESEVQAFSAEKYSMQVEEMDLSGKVVRLLMRNHITTVGELLEKTDEDLLNLPKFGKKSLEEVKRSLVAGGFVSEEGQIVESSESGDEGLEDS
ncbi:MAG: DNA-directed RNA polymerase subunit alpha [Dehalococcoidia bacterium]|nr:DNA-directed RNA polymerase subunit alpha [Dehalococcoidia bacterium]